MPRKARIDAPGALHHIIVRGIEKRNIFRSNQDRKNFLSRLEKLIPETTTDCFAWALMPNHVHLLLKTGMVPISVLMSRLLTGYAVWFNNKHRRHGQLFQNRYRSILCQEDAYFKELVRYIHLNPLRAGLVQDMKSLDTYPWCGHCTLMRASKNEWQNVDYVLKQFAPKKYLARKYYRAFIENGVNQGRRSDLTGGGLLRSAGGWHVLKALRKAHIRIKGDERILGDSEFVERTLEAVHESFEVSHDLRRKGYDFQRVVMRVAEVLAMEPDAVTALGKSPQTVKARRLVCYWAHRKLKMTTVEIGKKLHLSQPAVSRLSTEGEKLARDNHYNLMDRKV